MEERVRYEHDEPFRFFGKIEHEWVTAPEKLGGVRFCIRPMTASERGKWTTMRDAMYSSMSVVDNSFSAEPVTVERFEDCSREMVLRCVSNVEIDGKSELFTADMYDSISSEHAKTWLVNEVVNKSTITKGEKVGL
jgi:hypothetical protein